MSRPCNDSDRKHLRKRMGFTDEDLENDSIACALHNMGSTLAGNTQESDVEWFARWLYGASNHWMGSVVTFPWSISNEEFKKLSLTPDRQWTGKRWETLEDAERSAWLKFARLCLTGLPHIAERIGQRFMDQAKALRVLTSKRNKEL